MNDTGYPLIHNIYGGYTKFDLFCSSGDQSMLDSAGTNTKQSPALMDT